jgi:CyaY protein
MPQAARLRTIIRAAILDIFWGAVSEERDGITMDEKEFSALAAAALARIESALEAVDGDIDFELAAGGVLEIEFADGSKIVVNRHAVAREIWVAARAGGFHFRWDGDSWLDTRDGSELMAKLSQLASQQAGQPVDLA